MTKVNQLLVRNILHITIPIHEVWLAQEKKKKKDKF